MLSVVRPPLPTHKRRIIGAVVEHTVAIIAPLSVHGVDGTTGNDDDDDDGDCCRAVRLSVDNSGGANPSSGGKCDFRLVSAAN